MANQARRQPRKSRRKARELALQGLYQWKLTGDDADVIGVQLCEDEEYASADDGYLIDLLHGVARIAQDLNGEIAPVLDRRVEELSPIEHAVLLIATYEFVKHPEVPYRVVINEAVELAKAYGGTDGHKYVNGVLDKLAGRLRAVEMGAKQDG